jgi:tetratricopeptide (TPR) repeat protein
MVQTQPASRPQPVATGTLAAKPLAHLLVYALERALTGSFELIAKDGEEMRISVVAGQVARVSSSKPIAYLGHVLYEIGSIDDAQLSRSLAVVAATKRLHGQVLLATGVLDVARLADGLRRQRARKLHHAFELGAETSFAFYPGIDLIGERPNDVEPMDPLPSIWRGVLLQPSWDHVRSALATVGERPLRVVGSLERIALEGAELETAECLRKTPTRVEEIAQLAGLDPRVADLLAYFLVIGKVAELGPREGGSGPLSPPSVKSLPATAMGASLPSGQYTRAVSFTMRAVRDDKQPVRIPSPMPGRMTVVRSSADGASPPAAAANGGGPSVEAEHALSQAEMHFVLGDTAKAIECVRGALATDPGLPEAKALLAYLLMFRLDPPDDEAGLRDSLSLVDSAIRQNGTCRRAHFYRAEIKRRLEDHEGAIADFRIAVAHDANDVDARRELRIYEQKVKDGTIALGEGGSRGKRQGLLDRIRGKKI